MSWTKKNVHPGKILLDPHAAGRRGCARGRSGQAPHLARPCQTLENPWHAFAANHPVGSQVEGEVKNKTEFGLFIGLDGDVDGMVRAPFRPRLEPSGEQVIEEYQKGQMVKAQVLDVDIDKERISLGIKQLARDAAGDAGFRRPAQERGRHLRS